MEIDETGSISNAATPSEQEQKGETPPEKTPPEIKKNPVAHPL